MRRSVRRALPVVLGAALASCENGLAPRSMCACPPTLTLHPASLAITAGEWAPLTIELAGVLDSATIRLASLHPAVLRVDSIGQPGVPVLVHAVAPGGGVLRVTVTRRGQTVEGSVPVTVTARTTP